MIFNSVTFLIFLVIVITLYWILPGRSRLWMLLIASCIFYGFWRWEYLGVMFISALTDYFTALQIDKTPKEQTRKRKTLLAITLVVNLGLLFFFKYLFFLTTNINSVLDLFNSNLDLPLYHIILPFGISFYTFETISYTVDVYRGLIRAERNFVNYGLFVTFFPKLVAGPVQRAAELLDQLKKRPVFHVEYLAEGLKRIGYGLFLKVVIADRISPLVDEGFNIPAVDHSALDVWMLAFLFGWQIYFDFSAYSHIAVGTAKLMGIHIPENFNWPYIGTSFRDFWKRWHISLSSWIRDYLYLPLAGIKVVKTTGAGGIGEGLDKTEKSNPVRALFLTWAIMGLWHGAAWTFVVWGMYHAVIIWTERKLKPFRTKYSFFNNAILCWGVTMVLITLSWVPFRAENLTDMFVMLGKVFTPSEYLHIGIKENNFIIGALMMILFLLAYWCTHVLESRINERPIAFFAVNFVKFIVISGFVFTFLRPISQFIYFQF